MWQNNLLKFYMENDIVKAIDFAKDLIDEQGSILNKVDLCDLKFSLGTSYALEGNAAYLELAIKELKQSLEIADDHTKGYILNNLGMVNFYTFVAQSSEITDP